MFHTNDEERIAPERIRERRQAMGYSLRAMGKLMGVDYSTISRWEAGNRPNISYTTLTELSRLLSCDPGYLSGTQDTPKKEDYSNDESERILVSLLKSLSSEEKSELLQYCLKAYPEKCQNIQ